jgi:hypothetical protein
MIVNIIHLMKHNRDAFFGTFLLKGLVECEVMYRKLSDENKKHLKLHFETVNHPSVYTNWRALSCAVFEDANDHCKLSLANKLCLLEFNLTKRSRSYAVIWAIGHRAWNFATPSRWITGENIHRNRNILRYIFWRKHFKTLRDWNGQG